MDSAGPSASSRLVTYLPFAQASAPQRQQALASTRQVLEVAYPHLSRPHWEAALERVQPVLLVGATYTTVAHEGLVALVQHLAAPPGTVAGTYSAPAQRAVDLTGPSAASRPKKQTYAIRPVLLTQLERVSYWQRQPISYLVNEALQYWLGQYPEAHQAIPEPRRAAPRLTQT